MSGECGRDDCRKLRELLSEYVDADLREAVIRELDQHLEHCPDCHMQVDSVRKVIRLYREASADAIPYDVRIRLRDLIRRAREEESQA
jgi:anti-sigma factor (TIGR02949 family)